MVNLGFKPTLQILKKVVTSKPAKLAATSIVASGLGAGIYVKYKLYNDKLFAMIWAIEGVSRAKIVFCSAVFSKHKSFIKCLVPVASSPQAKAILEKYSFFYMFYLPLLEILKAK